MHTQVANALREQIVRGTLLPGARLNEVEPSDVMGISGIPLREAIKILEAENLLEVRPHKGAAAAEISLQAMEEIFELLAPLEGLGMELAMARMDDGEFGLLRNMHDQMLACYRAND